MKKYIKPTAEVVELSVKESLSELPAGMTKGVFVKQQLAAIMPYNIVVSEVKKNQVAPSVQ